jgi:serine/threonine protein phosphatase 1
MSQRIIAVGDVHGYAAALESLLAAIDPRPDDTLVALGDYCDRGPETPRVFDLLRGAARRCRLVPILGNHDEMLLDMHRGDPGLADWLSFGGSETLASYRVDSPEQIPEADIAFLEGCVAYFETEAHIFVHAAYLADLPMQWQPAHVLRWWSIAQRVPGPHVSGKTVVAGHTAQRNGEILDLGYLKCIDTCCYGGGRLTALDVSSGRVWQSDAEGRLRGD